MHNPLLVITIVCLYVIILFLIALWVERGSAKVKRIAHSPVVYALALAVYCTSWTYYGSVGSAANAGMLFLTIYLGPTMAIVLWWFVVRKLIRIKTAQRITSIADFVSARYGKSQVLAALATLLALIGTTPYIALQLKAVTSTFTLITVPDNALGSWIGGHVGPIVVVLMTLFTIMLGVRRLDPTERHEGVVAALAVECVVKLVAFLAAGIFVTFFVYDGFGDLFQRLAESPFRDILNVTGTDVASYLTWMTYLILAMSAIIFLPRQFHVTVVENSNEGHLKTAIWLFPLYLFLINIFVVPIAAGGLLQGLPASEADAFVLNLPLLFNQSWLSLMVFIGGFSAATGMIIVSSMTTATMITNHLLLPLVAWAPGLNFLQRYLLRVRWAAVALILLLGYGFEQLTGDSYTLVNMGIISFAAVLQFAPAILGGLFWSRANRMGALLGLSAGFFIWFYTLLLPSFVRSGWLSNTLLDSGPLGLVWLKPEQLLGVVGLPALPHTVFWSMLFNIGLYVLGSLYFEKNEQERRLTEAFVGALKVVGPLRGSSLGEATVDLAEKRGILEDLLGRYFAPTEAIALVEKCVKVAGLTNEQQITVGELARLYNEAEKILAGSIGAASAHRAFSQTTFFNPAESEQLSDVYSQILVDLRVSPEELRERVDYYRERDAILSDQAVELERKVVERTRALKASAEISHQIAAILDIDELLHQVVTLIQKTFEYYQVHIYILDQKTGELIMREGSGEVGQQLKALKHKLQPGQGIVGKVAQTGSAFLAPNVEEVAGFFHNPLLPKTRSELAIPLLKGDKILGVLDMQSEKVGGFDQEDLILMQSIADQVAVALDNARLFRATQSAIAEAEELNRRLTREAWRDIDKKATTTGYVFTPLGARANANEWLDTMPQAIRQKKLTTQLPLDHNGGGTNGTTTSIAIPLVLRNEVIGVIGIERPTDRQWSEDELTIVQTVTEQIALALDTARLARETERAAWRDRVVSESTARVWSSDEIEEVLRAAVAELGDKLRASEVVIRLGTEDQLLQQPE